jgi:virulence-associated protein VapD
VYKVDLKIEMQQKEKPAAILMTYSRFRKVVPKGGLEPPQGNPY